MDRLKSFFDNMRHLAIFLFMAMGMTNLSAQTTKTLIDQDWQFYLGDDPLAKNIEYNTKDWQAVDLPHDWSVALPFDREAAAGNDGAYLPTGKGWYRKELVIPKSYRGKCLRLYFEGVYMDAAVYVNGEYCGAAWKEPYKVDISKAVKPGKNLLEVKVANVWVNRLIGDEQPGAIRIGWTDSQGFTGNEPLIPAGLLGPVNIINYE